MYTREQINAALTKVKEQLKTEEIVHGKAHEFLDPEVEEYIFNMNQILVFNSNEYSSKLSHACSTTGCIGGWLFTELRNNSKQWKLTTFQDKLGVEDEARKFIRWASDADPVLKTLFYPPEGIDYDHISNDDAVRAIDEYLTTNNVDWYRLLGLVEGVDYINTETDEDHPW